MYMISVPWTAVNWNLVKAILVKQCGLAYGSGSDFLLSISTLHKQSWIYKEKWQQSFAVIWIRPTAQRKILKNALMQEIQFVSLNRTQFCFCLCFRSRHFYMLWMCIITKYMCSLNIWLLIGSYQHKYLWKRRECVAVMEPRLLWWKSCSALCGNLAGC